MPETFYLIDGHSHLYRAFFALKGLSGPDGRPTNAVYGFTTMLRKLIRERKPDYLAVAFDVKAKTFRHTLFTDYKATRKAAPDEFHAQLPMTVAVLEALRIPVFTKEGYEADDVMGTLARVVSESGLNIVLVTGDKDAEQLIGPRVTVLDTGKDVVIDEAALRAKGYLPEQVIEMMSLSGDSTDNIHGIPKVGPKTALELIQRFGTLEETLVHADEVKAPKLRENLKMHAEEARLARKLVTIDTHVPIDIDLEECRLKEPDHERLAEVYRQYGFKQLLADMELPPTREKTSNYQLVDTPEKFEAFMAGLREQQRFSIDLETTSTRPMEAHICGMSFSCKEGSAWYLPLLCPITDKKLHKPSTLDTLRPILEDPAIEKTGQNIKYDALVLRAHGVRLKGIVFDTMVAAYVLDPERRRYGLDELASDFLDYRMIPISSLIGKGRSQTTMDCVPAQQVCDYACADADVTLRLAELLGPELQKQGMLPLFREIEMPLLSVLVEMEYAGIALNAGALKEMSGWLADKMSGLEKDIYAEAGEEFNINSPRQLAAVLFDKLGLPKGKKTKTGVSTNVDVLEQLAVAHRLPGLVLEYRQFAKLKSTYVDTLPELVASRTGRIHTSFNQTATATGRLSSSEPNLQNIPIRTEQGERIRRAFVAGSEDNILLTADYSQIELRILAHLCADEALRGAFAHDEDIHRFVAAQIHNVAMEAVTSNMRRAAKAVNFGIIYGLTPYGLSRDLRIPVDEAARFIEDYFARYPGVKQFIEQTVEEARKAGAVFTLLGRRRPMPGINDTDRMRRAFAERAAVNSVIQGTAADMIKIAMIRIETRLRREGLSARMLLQIHDELLFELPLKEEAPVRELVTEEMTAALKLDVPVKVNVAVGKNWMEAK